MTNNGNHGYSSTHVQAEPIAEAGRHYLLRRDIAFLNHGSFGACPRPVFDTYQEWQRRLESQPVAFLGRELTGYLASARQPLATYLGTQPEQLVFVTNATLGMNIVARSLDLQPGDEVLGTNHEYGAVERTWRFNCAQRGAHYRSQSISLPVTSPDAIIDQLWEGVTKRTRVIVVSHISSPTAVIFPVAAICQRAREQGILTIIDGAHAPGQIALDLDAIGADFYTGNCHKWLCAPKGAGFLYARPEHQASLQPLIVSWGWESRAPGPSRFHDYFDWTGTADPAAYLSVPAAIDFQAQHDWPSVRAACHRIVNDARHRIATLTGLSHIVPDSDEWWCQMCAIPLPPCDVVELQRRLYDEYQVEVPLTEWDGRPFVRISIQAYNSPANIDRLMDGLSHLL